MAAALEPKRVIRLQLRTRYALTLLALLLATVGSLSVALLTEFSVTAGNLREVSAKLMDEALLRQYERRAEDLSITLAESLTDAVYLLQVDSLSAIADGLTERADINAIAVFDNTGLLYYSGTIPGMAEDVLDSHFISYNYFDNASTITQYRDQAVTSSAPITISGKVIGHVLVDLSLAPIKEQITYVRDEQSQLIGNGLKLGLWASVGITLTFGGLGIILAVFMGDRLSRPIDALSKLARRIGRGDYNIPEDLKGGGEIQDLVRSFHSMASDLRNTTVSKAHLDDILHGMLDGLLVVGVDGRILTTNRATHALLGYDEGELRGQPVSAFFHAPALASLQEKSNMASEGTARKKNGDGLPVLLSISALRKNPATGASTVWVFRDITSLKTTQNALVAAMQESERANHAKSQFLANMSHELRTPLNAIIGYSEMLVDEARDLEGQEGMAEDLNRIHAAGRHLLGLIDDVLDLSKIEAGKMDLNRDEFQLQTAIKDVAATVRPMLEERRNSLTIDCQPDLAPIISDQVKIRQILFNILSNAAKFTEDGTIVVTVRTENHRGADRIMIKIEDSGIGMTPDQLERVFGEFIQADSSTTRQYGGTGLGLAISRKMTQMLGGEISAASVPGKGSTFTIELPAIMSEPATVTPKFSAPTTVSVGNTGAKSGRILLVMDQNPDELDRAARELAGWGFGVVSASQSQEGLRLARELQPMAILLAETMRNTEMSLVSSLLNDDPVTAGIPVIDLPNPMDKSGDHEDLLNKLTKLFPSTKDKLALIVEDEANTRRLLSRSLKKAGWEIAEADNGQDALERIQSRIPDLIVLDLMMPVMDGETFLQVLRSNPDYVTVPVMIVTAKPISAIERTKLQHNAETVIEKGANGWVEAVRVMGGALGREADNAQAVRGG
ncbi:MAG: ATP-binding protein [Alphaproteobacteria bacterium]|nr:ATP-binding protein [Alphaproteobacteria bacterium]